VAMAWLAKVCNGIKYYRNVHASLTQTAGKITIRINKQKIIKEYLPEIQKVTNHTTYITKQCQGVQNDTATVQLPTAKVSKQLMVGHLWPVGHLYPFYYTPIYKCTSDQIT
jgi:hypothetical protein